MATIARGLPRSKVGGGGAAPIHDDELRLGYPFGGGTLREGCLDHLGTMTQLHDVPARLLAFLAEHYHQAPQAGCSANRLPRRGRPRPSSPGQLRIGSDSGGG